MTSLIQDLRSAPEGARELSDEVLLAMGIVTEARSHPTDLRVVAFNIRALKHGDDE